MEFDAGDGSPKIKRDAFLMPQLHFQALPGLAGANTLNHASKKACIEGT
jgi:hypothetical protein